MKTNTQTGVILNCNEGIIEVGHYDGYTMHATIVDNRGTKIDWTTGESVNGRTYQSGPWQGCEIGSQVYGNRPDEAAENIRKTLSWNIKIKKYSI